MVQVMEVSPEARRELEGGIWRATLLVGLLPFMSCDADRQEVPPPALVPFTVEFDRPVVSMVLTFSAELKVTVALELLNRDKLDGRMHCRTDVDELDGTFVSRSGRLPSEVLDISFKADPRVVCEFALSEGPPVVATVSLFPAPNYCGKPAAPTDRARVVDTGIVCTGVEFPEMVDVQGTLTLAVTVLVGTT